MTLPPTASPALQSLSLSAALPADQLRLHSRSMMLTISFAIEDLAGASGPHTVLIATFQRLSLFQPQLERYARIAPRVAQVFVLGVPDVAPPPIPNLTVLPIAASWPLAQEWAVIASGPGCCAALITRDAEGFRPDQRSRRFAGRWSADRREVAAALARFYAALGQAPPAAPSDERASLRSSAAIRAALARR